MKTVGQQIVLILWECYTLICEHKYHINNTSLYLKSGTSSSPEENYFNGMSK